MSTILIFLAMALAPLSQAGLMSTYEAPEQAITQVNPVPQGAFNGPSQAPTQAPVQALEQAENEADEAAAWLSLDTTTGGAGAPTTGDIMLEYIDTVTAPHECTATQFTVSDTEDPAKTHIFQYSYYTTA